MCENKRTPDQIEGDRALITQLLRKGAIQQEITDSINVRYKELKVDIKLSRQQIAYDIKKIRARWKEEIIEDINEIIINEIQNLKWAEKEAKEAWLESKGKQTKTSSKTRLSDGKKSKSVEKSSSSEDYIEESEFTEYSAGDPRFLAIAIDCSDRVTKLYGIFKKDDEPLEIPDDEETEVEVRIPDNGRD